MLLGSQRRQFSRREANRQAVALIPGFEPVACELKNVSEGGALIAFGNSYLPEKPFRLIIEGIALSCEVRHSTVNGIGVRFQNLNEGLQLIKQLYQPLLPAPSQWTPDVDTVPTPVSVRSLREGLKAQRVGLTTTPVSAAVEPIAEADPAFQSQDSEQ